MAQTVSKRWLAVLGLSVLAGLIGLIVWLMQRNSPKGTIRRRLKTYNIPEQTIKYWTAVSAFETNYWKSRVFGDSRNLFNLIVPGSVKLPYGEGQTVYSNTAASVDELFSRVIKPKKYPLSYNSLAELVGVMKAKGYFTFPADAYLAGADAAYKKLYPTS